jgi:hypothetical protein
MIKISVHEHLTVSEQPEVLGGLLDVPKGMIGADINQHKDGLIFTTVGSSRTRITLLRIAGK